MKTLFACEIRNSGLWNPGIQAKESGILLTIEIRNPVLGVLWHFSIF